MLANIGIPMLALVLPGFVLALPLVIGAEGWIVARHVPTRVPVALGVMAWANLASTLIGVPITWVVLFVCEMAISMSIGQWWPEIAAQIPASAFQKVMALVVQAPWLGGPEEDLPWMIPAAALLLLGPFCAASYYVERFVATRKLPELPKDVVNRAVLRANLASYAGFAAVCGAWLARGLAASAD